MIKKIIKNKWWGITIFTLSIACIATYLTFFMNKVDDVHYFTFTKKIQSISYTNSLLNVRKFKKYNFNGDLVSITYEEHYSDRIKSKTVFYNTNQGKVCSEFLLPFRTNHAVQYFYKYNNTKKPINGLLEIYDEPDSLIARYNLSDGYQEGLSIDIFNKYKYSDDHKTFWFSRTEKTIYKDKRISEVTIEHSDVSGYAAQGVHIDFDTEKRVFFENNTKKTFFLNNKIVATICFADNIHLGSKKCDFE